MRPAVGDMTIQIKNRFASQKEQKDEKKDIYKHLTVQGKRRKNFDNEELGMRKEELSKCTIGRICNPATLIIRIFNPK